MSLERPNIILVTTDQQRTDSLSCYGSTFTQTPHLDALASAGVCCDRAYTTNPVCTPARISLFTGLQVSSHGAWNVGLNAPAQTRTVAHHLADHGYRTHNIGKMHFQAYGSRDDQSLESFTRRWGAHPPFPGPYYGFQTVEFALGHATYGLRGHYGEWVRSQVDEKTFCAFQHAQALSPAPFGGEAYDWDLPLRLHNSVWSVDRAIEFLRGNDKSQPFFLSLGFQDPHHPHCLPREFTNRIRPEDVPLPDYTEGELDDKPPHFKIARKGELDTSVFRGEYQVAGQGCGFDYRRIGSPEIRAGRAYYYGMVRLIDDQMGLLQYLDDTRLAENTLVIFTSDHGELLGDHGLWMKGPFHYEQILRIPLLLRWPKGFAGGRRVETIVSHLDLVPTILSAVGLPPVQGLNGSDALPLFRGEVAAIRDGAMIECIDDPRKLRLKTYITLERKLTWYHGHPFGELYDLVLDPGEKINRWNDPEYADDRSRLLSQILERLEPLEKRAARDCYA
jgi:arylsulfatase A-like enzyme